jgi:ABC-type nitrate/sulfonate/bicarbonate transport system permease component
MFMKVLAVALALSHVATIGLIVLWFGLGKPKSRIEFWRRFKREFLPLSPTR